MGRGGIELANDTGSSPWRPSSGREYSPYPKGRKGREGKRRQAGLTDLECWEDGVELMMLVEG
jgi:hypothetical protein